MVIRGCIRGRYRSLSIRFRAISHGARLGKGDAKSQAASVARRYFWIHDAFFDDAHPSIPRAATKGNRWKNVADAEGRKDSRAHNRREL